MRYRKLRKLVGAFLRAWSAYDNEGPTIECKGCKRGKECDGDNCPIGEALWDAIEALRDEVTP